MQTLESIVFVLFFAPPVFLVVTRHFFFSFQTEELLTDVLYSVHSLMGGTMAGVWNVGGESDLGGPSTRALVQVEQVVEVLQGAFQVSPETTNRLRVDVQRRPVSGGSGRRRCISLIFV